jgi:hypothetical protein
MRYGCRAGNSSSSESPDSRWVSSTPWESANWEVTKAAAAEEWLRDKSAPYNILDGRLRAMKLRRSLTTQS